MVLSKESQQPLGIASVPITQPPETESQRRPYLRTQPRLSKQALRRGWAKAPAPGAIIAARGRSAGRPSRTPADRPNGCRSTARADQDRAHDPGLSARGRDTAG